MSDLDMARQEAVELLGSMIFLACTGALISAQAFDRFDDLGRQYVTAQARYTNMLRDWEAG